MRFLCLLTLVINCTDQPKQRRRRVGIQASGSCQAHGPERADILVQTQKILLAEGQGFEPWKAVTPCWFSRPAAFNRSARVGTAIPDCFMNFKVSVAHDDELDDWISQQLKSLSRSIFSL